jgi:hypothetical protein
MLQRIKHPAKDDSRAAAEWLRLTFPNDYRKPSSTSVEVNTAVQMAVVCSEERRQELLSSESDFSLLKRARPNEFEYNDFAITRDEVDCRD